MIDRIEPTRRPTGKNDGTQKWSDLLFCHWPVPVSSLRAVVPSELEIDTFDGTAYVATVPFKMREVRPSWLPRRLAFNFLETNVRTYVVHNGRPGVYFMSLDASSRLAVWAARTGWSLPYYFANMSFEETNEHSIYQSYRPANKSASHRVCFSVGKELGISQVGTLEHFLFERYLLFAQRKKNIVVGAVHHKPYQVSLADVKTMDDGLLDAAGVHDINRLPELAHFSSGVDVEVFGIESV